MSGKSRGSYSINLCIKFDCSSRDLTCNTCNKFSNYVKKEVRSEDTKKDTN